MANNNIPSPDPFVLEQLIEDSSREVTNRNRQERALAGQRRPRHETSQPQRQQIQHIQHVHGLQQVQNVEQTHPEGQVQNGEDGQTRPQTEPEQLQVVNETDTRDGQPASSFTHTSGRRRSRSPDEEEQINIPEGADPTAVLLLKELQKTNRLIRLQGDRIHDLERKRRYRSLQRRRHRSRSYSSSRSPPRRNRKRSPSRSRSPSRRNRRQRSYSRSPPRKTRKNQKPETTEAKSLSPEQEHRGPSKAVQKVREHSPKDNRKISGKARTKSQRGRHSNSPEPSDEEDFRSPLSEQIRRVRLPRGMEKPPALDHYDGTTDPDDHIRSIEAVMDYHVAEAANRVILRGLKRRLGEAKKAWVEELHSVLWAYRTTPHSTTGETPFRLTYGTEAVIPVEIREPSRRTESPLEEELNDEAMREELDMVEEIRTGSSLREAKLKQQIALRHSTKVIKRGFEIGDLVLRRNMKDSHEGKLAPNWEGPYRVYDKTENDKHK
ncbi:uncharacterized protein LOC131650274 [Vicia villosa]|uniref:uncharacterized protein LOC131650274 n=1 Tax=Vicia villosa TaxID=3911 RepID=UPI00273BD8EE|nr:uncharacterized protein LOC131650274 [Vicia villosa]